MMVFRATLLILGGGFAMVWSTVDSTAGEVSNDPDLVDSPWAIRLDEPRFGVVVAPTEKVNLRGQVSYVPPQKTSGGASVWAKPSEAMELCVHIDASHHEGGTHVCLPIANEEEASEGGGGSSGAAGSRSSSRFTTPFHLGLEQVPPGTHEVNVKFRVGCGGDISSDRNDDDNRCHEVEVSSLFDVLPPRSSPSTTTNTAGNTASATRLARSPFSFSSGLAEDGPRTDTPPVNSHANPPRIRVGIVSCMSMGGQEVLSLRQAQLLTMGERGWRTAYVLCVCVCVRVRVCVCLCTP